MTIRPDELAERFDRALAAGLEKAWRDSHPGARDGEALHRTQFDITECLRELNAIRAGGDFCYDRPGSAFAYAAWYHGERVNQFMAVLSALPELQGRTAPWRIVDLGAGTGAVGWAIAGHELLRPKSSAVPPPLVLEMVESSRPMLHLARRLWQALEAEFRKERLGARVRVEGPRAWRHESWPAMQMAREETDLLTAHYLFDHSETDPDIASESVELFRRQMRHQRVRRLLCCTTSQKRVVLQRLGKELSATGWRAEARELGAGPLSGLLQRVGVFRRGVASAVGDPKLRERGAVAPTFCGKAKRPAIVLAARTGDLFPELSSAKDVLTHEQERALDDRNRHVSIRGSAGSGKTLVLSHRLAAKLSGLMPMVCSGTILFTSFNDPLVQRVAEETLGLVEGQASPTDRPLIRIDRNDGGLCIRVGDRSPVQFMTFDMVVSRLFGIRAGLVSGSDGSVFSLAADVLRDPRNRTAVERLPVGAFPVAAEGEESVGRRSVSRSAAFLSEEFRTVFYGRAGCDDRAYRDPGRIDRGGRGIRLAEGQRSACADLLSQIQHKFTNRRRAAGSADVVRRFSEIVVDEAQDFTDFDFGLLARLLEPGGSWTIAFDTSQAIRTGVTFKAPRMKPDWSRHRLTGSYRMPLRVCEALVPIVRHIESRQAAVGVDAQHLAAPPVPSRLAVLGSRPMVVAAPDEKRFAERMREIVSTFDPPLDTKPPVSVIVLEKDRALASELERHFPKGARIATTASSVLKEKGMEYPWVVWSTRTPCAEPLDLHQLCYTIVSRCTRHMVIWLQTDGAGRVLDRTLAPILSGDSALRRDRLLVVDEFTVGALRSLEEEPG